MTIEDKLDSIPPKYGAPTAGVTLDQINRTIEKIAQSLRDWEEGRMTSPDDRDHVIDACEVMNLDWHQIDRDSDNDIIGKIANEIYEDSGETITSITDLATYILTRLFQEGLRPVEPKRTILVHLNVEVEPFDTRSPDQIADYLLACIEVGGEGNEKSEGLSTIVIPLAEEV